MVAKLQMNETDRADHVRNLARLRAKKYYNEKKDNPDFKEKRRIYAKKDKQILKDHPPKNRKTLKLVNEVIVDEIPEPNYVDEIPPPSGPPSQPLSTKNNKIYNVRTIKNKKYTIPKISADSVKKFMIENPNFVLDRKKQTPIPASTLKDYVGRLSTLAKEINGTDSFITAFMDYEKTVDILKNLKKKDGEPQGYNSISKKLTVLFSAIRCLNRAGLLHPLTDEKLNPIFEKYDELFQQKNVERIIVEAGNRENPEYAVPEWSDFEDKIVENYGETSTEHLITVLYRFNTVRNDYVGLNVVKNAYTDGDENGFYIPAGIANVRVVSNRKKTGDGYGKIDYTFDKSVSAIIRKYIKIKKIKDGEPLLPNSINDIVKNMLDKVGVKMPKNAKPVSVFRNIDSGIGGVMDAEALVQKAKRSGHSVGTKLNTYGRKKQEPVVLENTVVRNTRSKK